MINVSVVIPIYNTEKYLRRCLDSVVNQTLKNIEIICVNDGSTDNSHLILEQYASKDKRIKIINKKNGGLSSARNCGMKSASGKYVGFIDSDDWVDLNFLEVLYNTSENSGADIARAPYKYCFSDKQIDCEIVQLLHKRHSNNEDLGVNEHSIVVWNSLYRFEFLKNINIEFDENISNAEDIPFTAKTSFLAKKIVPVVNTYYYYDKSRENQLSALSLKRCESMMLANKAAVSFLNSVSKESEKHKADYIEAFKRIMWRYDDTFRKVREMEWFDNAKKKLFVIDFIENFHKCKYIGDFSKKYNEKYFKFLVNKDAGGYINDIAKENMTPKVSVIIPVYNAEKYLRQCLDSVVNQTLKDIEIVCVNDGSTDGSLEILREYEKKDKRFEVINQKNQGAGAARNNGIAYAKGQYISFLDSDDYVEHSMLEEMSAHADKFNADICLCDAYFYENEQLISTKRYLHVNVIKTNIGKTEVFSYKQIPDKILNMGPPIVWNRIYRKDFIINSGIKFQTVKISNDVYFSLVLLAMAQKISFIDKKLVHYRYNHSVSTTSLRKKDKDITLILRIYKDIASVLKQKGIFDSIKTSYYQRMLDCVFYTYGTMDHSVRKDFMKALKKELPLEQFEQLKHRIHASQSLELIISLTSYPARIATVHITIESLLSQTKKADKIVLWLADSQFPNKETDLPKELTYLTKKGLTISWCEDIKSYKKLIPALKKYPNSIIVTADDDNIYEKDWLKKLYESYLKNPQALHCHRARLITFKNGQLQPYKEWEICGSTIRTASFLNFFTGIGGILYPPNVFYKDITDKELFMNLCPHGDDIWFWVMAVLNNVKINIVESNNFKTNAIKGTEDTALWHENVLQGRNDKQIKNVFKQYPKFLKKIKTEYRTQKTRQFIESLVTLKWLYCEYKEPNHKVFRVLGMKIKIRNDKRAKIKRMIKSFFENLIGAKNAGDYKIFSFLFLKLKFKNKHKILLARLDQNQKQIAALNNKLLLLDKNTADLKNQIVLQNKITEEKISQLKDGISKGEGNVSKSIADLKNQIVLQNETSEEKNSHLNGDISDLKNQIILQNKTSEEKIGQLKSGIMQAEDNVAKNIADLKNQIVSQNKTTEEKIGRLISGLEQAENNAAKNFEDLKNQTLLQNKAVEEKISQLKGGLEQTENNAAKNFEDMKNQIVSQNKITEEKIGRLISGLEQAENNAAKNFENLKNQALLQNKAAEEKFTQLKDGIVKTESGIALKYEQDLKKSTDILKNIDKQARGSLNAQKFQSTIIGSKWLKEQNFTAGGWAMDNLGLYTVFRILNDMKPKNILEFGLGQSSKLVHQYAGFKNNNAKALTIEHDKQWIEFFLNEVSKYKMNIKEYDIVKIEINGAETLTYAGLKNLYKCKFDFILVDGPFGQKKYSRPQILDFAKSGLPERFCILIDDTEREGEKETLNMLFEIFKGQKREFLTRTYNGEKNSHNIICSPDLKFLTSL